MPNRKKNKSNLKLPLILLCSVAVIAIIAYVFCSHSFLFQGSALQQDNFAKPIFTSPQDELQQVSDASFTQELFNQATELEPLLKQPGTQVHLGFWSQREIMAIS